MDDIPARNTDRPPPADAPGRRAKPLGVAGVGAGAGGIEAAQLLFGAMPVDTGLAFVVCRRVQPGLSDPLADLLRTQTAMPVIRAAHGMALEAGCIYLVAPDAQMIVLQNRLISLSASATDNAGAAGSAGAASRAGATSTAGDTELACSPIDLLLHSLAASKGANAIAIVLSGADRDGVRGCASIRDQGGLVLAQHPESTEFAELPRRVIEADVAQAVAPPGAMADLIQRHLGKNRRTRGDQPMKDQGDQEALARIAKQLEARFAVDLAAYRPSMVAKRVRRRQAMSGADRLVDYAERLSTDDAELSALHDDLMIGVTGFYRDADAFAALKQEVVPVLIERMSADRPIRIWVPAAASGEEAYSLAMLILDRIDCAGKEAHLEILASDRHAAALKRARFGRYRRDRLGNVPPELVACYMQGDGAQVEVGPRLRRHVTFVDHDILKAPPPDDIDLVSCRNLLIYLAAGSREMALAACSDALKPDGFLFLGPSEQPGAVITGLATIHGKWRIYRKTAAPKVDDALERLVSTKRQAPAETILPDDIEGLHSGAPLPPASDPADKPDGSDVSDGLDSVMAKNQRMLESTIDTLLQSNDALRRRNGDLRAENRRLASANAALDDVATMIAHDLKAPLHTVDRLTERLKSALGEASAEQDAKSLLQPMQHQLAGLKRLIDDLLVYARQGPVDTSDLQSVDIGDLLRETLTLIGLPKGVKVLMQPPSLRVTTARVPLACILRNLLAQAIERIGDVSGSIRIDAMSSGDGLEMTIADDGSGPSDRNGGLGQAIVRQLLDASGGRLATGTDPAGSGHKLKLSWPIQDANSSKASADRSSSE